MNVEDLKEIILTSKEKVLKKYLTWHFGENQSVRSLMNNLEEIKKLDENTILYGIARMNQIEAKFDQSKYFAALVAILSSMILIYRELFNIYFLLVFATVSWLLVIRIYMVEKQTRTVAVYFRSLLEQVKELKKEENKELDKQ